MLSNNFLANGFFIGNKKPAIFHKGKAVFLEIPTVTPEKVSIPGYSASAMPSALQKKVLR